MHQRPCCADGTVIALKKKGAKVFKEIEDISLEQQRAAVRSFREDFHLLLQMKDRALGDDRLMKVLRHAATMIAMVQKMFDAPTHDELIEQKLDTLMREALLAVDPEEAEHFKGTKEAFQRVVNCRAEP